MTKMVTMTMVEIVAALTLGRWMRMVMTAAVGMGVQEIAAPQHPVYLALRRLECCGNKSWNQ